MIWLVRHAEAQDAAGCYVGSTDLPLSKTGQKQAGALGRAMAGLDLRALYSSPLRRAMDTASAVARTCGLSVVTLAPELAEIHLGAWEGRSMKDIQRQHPEAYAARGKDFAGFRPPGGESFTDLAERALRGLNKLADGPRPCAVVTHAGVIRALLCRVHGLSLNDIFRFKPKPAHAWALEHKDKDWILRHENLPPEKLAAMARQD